MKIGAKICGLSTAGSIDAAVSNGADYIGFVFFARSPRNVSLQQAVALASHAPPPIRKIGLFVDAENDFIEARVSALGLHILQLHGDETAERAAYLRQRFNRLVMKAVKVESAADLAQASRYIGAVDWLLFDAKPPKAADALPGGNGASFDWTLLRGRDWPVPWMLSGGLTADNVAEAVRVTGAQAVDVSSGVETSPGVKDPQLIRDFLQRVRSLG